MRRVLTRARTATRGVAVLTAGLALAASDLGASPVAAEPSESSEPGGPAARRTTVVTASAPFVALPMEDYAGYEPQTKCIRKPRPGVLLLADFLVARGGGYGPIARSCRGSGTSEHKESRAFDWMLDARSPADRAVARAFLDEVLAPDDTGQPHALARRMGIMYIIWNDRSYASYRGFEPQPYLSSGCRTRKRCSQTLRHRDHVHISLTRKAARGKLSWYLAQHSD